MVDLLHKVLAGGLAATGLAALQGAVATPQLQAAPQQPALQQQPFSGFALPQLQAQLQQQVQLQQLQQQQSATPDLAAAMARVQAMSAALPGTSTCNKVIRELYIGGLPPGVTIAASQVCA